MPSFTVWFADEWGGGDDGGMYDYLRLFNVNMKSSASILNISDSH